MGIQFVTKPLLGTTNGEHRIFIDVETCLCLGTKNGFTVGVLQVFPNRNHELQRRLSEDSCVCWEHPEPNRTKVVERRISEGGQLTRSSKVCIAMHLRRLRYPIKFSLQYDVAIALAFWRGAAARLSIYG